MCHYYDPDYCETTCCEYCDIHEGEEEPERKIVLFWVVNDRDRFIPKHKIIEPRYLWSFLYDLRHIGGISDIEWYWLGVEPV